LSPLDISDIQLAGVIEKRKMKRPTIIGIPYESSPYPMNEDLYIDMQYAQHGCIPADFAAEPWKHCKDHTNAYLSLRFDKRHQFKENTTQEVREQVMQEETRIRQTRVNFTSYEKKKTMLANLKNAKSEWKMEVKARREEEAKRIENYARNYPAQWSQHQELGLEYLERLKSWNASDVEEESSLQLKPDLEYGFKAYAIYFQKKCSGYEEFTHDNPKFLGAAFPNQKISVHSILQEEEGNPLAELCPSDRLRYFHFPTNNMRWIEVGML
jgi:predicted transcriptional regulator